jgi:hypothetical protein
LVLRKRGRQDNGVSGNADQNSFSRDVKITTSSPLLTFHILSCPIAFSHFLHYNAFMDMEQLSKAQIILLTLLVSFVTSIATGIVTVTLLEQAPDPVTQTINRIVERTVERVVPNTDDLQATVITKEIETVVVRDEDILAGSIDSVGNSLVRIYTTPPPSEDISSTNATTTGIDTPSEVFRGVGVFVTADGLVATADSVLVPGRIYRVRTTDGTAYSAVIAVEGAGQVGLLKVAPPESGKTFTPVAFTNISKLRLGQSVFTLEGERSVVVATGIISSLNTKTVTVTNKLNGESGAEDAPSADTTSIKTVLDTISATVKASSPGLPLSSLFGEVVGVYLPNTGVFVPIDAETVTTLRSIIGAVENGPKTKEGPST